MSVDPALVHALSQVGTVVMIWVIFALVLRGAIISARQRRELLDMIRRHGLEESVAERQMRMAATPPRIPRLPEARPPARGLAHEEARCGYCGRVRLVGRSNCEGCGAPYPGERREERR